MNSGILTKRIAAWRETVAFLVVAACVAVTPVDSSAAVKIGKTTVIVSKVTGTIDKNLRVLAIKDDVHQDEIVEAAKASASEIVFLDNTRIAIGPNTRLTLDRFVYDPDKGKGTMEMTLVEGVFRFTSGGISEKSKANYIVHTPTATIGIRGTIVSTVIGDDGQVATVLETPSVVTVAGTDGTIKTLDTPGTAITASADGVLGDPEEPPAWALKRIAELRALLSGAASDTAGAPDVNPPSPPAPPAPPAPPDAAPPAEPPAPEPPAEPPSTGRGLTQAKSVASPNAQSDSTRGLGKATDRGDTSAEGNASHGRGKGADGASGPSPSEGSAQGAGEAGDGGKGKGKSGKGEGGKGKGSGGKGGGKGGGGGSGGGAGSRG